MHLLGLEPDRLAATDPLQPRQLAERLVARGIRHRCLPMAIMLDLCRPPRSEAQLQRLEAFSALLGFDGAELRIVQGLCQRSAAEATADFVRIDGTVSPELSGPGGVLLGGGDGELRSNDGVFAQFHERKGMSACRAATSMRWACSSTAANSRSCPRAAMASPSLVSKVGGAPSICPGPRNCGWKHGAGGTACTGDFSRLDHLTLADVPLPELPAGPPVRQPVAAPAPARPSPPRHRS